MKNYRNLLVVLAITTLVFACGKTKTSEQGDQEAFKEAQQSFNEQFKEVVYSIPKPSEIPYLLESTGADFNQSLIADNKKVDQYMTHSDKAALILGAYATDIGYLSSYEKTQDAISYLNACKKLADKLNIIGSFDVSDLKRFEANISNKDSLANLLDASIIKADKYLRQENQNNRLSALILTGSFLEGLSISTELIKTFPTTLLKNDQRNVVLAPLVKIILSQSKSVNEIIKMLETLEATEPVPALMTELKKLQASYQGIQLNPTEAKNASEVLTNKNLIEITEITERLKKIVIE